MEETGNRGEGHRGASGGKALAHINQIAMDQGKHRTP
jgi:hypothetical protein